MVLSSTMAIRFLTFSPVIRSNSRPPFASNVIETYGSLNWPIATRASLKHVAGEHDSFLDEVGDSVLASRIPFHAPFEQDLTAFRHLAFRLLHDLGLAVFGNAGGQIELHLVLFVGILNSRSAVSLIRSLARLGSRTPGS